MAKEFGLFYREGPADYVLNDRGKLFYDPKTCRTFKKLEDVAAYLCRNYGDRISLLQIEGILDLEGHPDKKRISELERKLNGTRIKIVKN